MTAAGDTLRVTARELRDACLFAMVGAGVVPAEAGPAAELAVRLHARGAGGIAMVLDQTRRDRIGRAPVHAVRDGDQVSLSAAGPRSLLLLAAPAADLLETGSTVHVTGVEPGPEPCWIAAACADRTRRSVRARYRDGAGVTACDTHRPDTDAPTPPPVPTARPDPARTGPGPRTGTLTLVAASAPTGHPRAPVPSADLTVAGPDWARLESLARCARRTDPSPPTFS